MKKCKCIILFLLVNAGFLCAESLKQTEEINRLSEAANLKEETEAVFGNSQTEQEFAGESSFEIPEAENIAANENERESSAGNCEAETEAEILPQKIVEYKKLNLPGAERAEVEYFRQMYLGKWSAQLRAYLESAMEYRLFVRKSIADRNLPEELEYLPVVESNYKTTAKSRSGAIGMWQFMANSVAPFLTLNDFVDERYDPWKSTDAALRKLTDNYNYFHDWELAIGAYNCGIGAMNKALKKAPANQKNFWYLVEHKLLTVQTSQYVPKLIAIADLAINSEYYGIDLPDHKEEYELLQNEKEGNFDYITVKKAYSISALAREMKMDEQLLKNLNPSYILGVTHPSKTSQIRLPLGMEQSAVDALKKLEPFDFPEKYTVVAGDSLWSISRRYGVSVKAICELNDIQENAILKIGKILYIPVK